MQFTIYTELVNRINNLRKLLRILWGAIKNFMFIIAAHKDNDLKFWRKSDLLLGCLKKIIDISL